MNIIAKLSGHMKILILLLLPFAGLAYFAIHYAEKSAQIGSEMAMVQNLSRFAVRASALVHEIQKERGATAGFLGSKGTKFVAELSAQWRDTDKRAAELRRFLQGFESGLYDSEFNSQLSDALDRLDQLESKRNVVISTMNIAAAEAIGYYTGMNGAFLGIIERMTKLSNNGEVTRLITAYVNFLQGKERVGIERAVMSNTFARDNFGPGMLKKFGDLVSKQETYARVFQSFATEEARQYYRNKMRGSSVDEVARMRKVAFDKASEGGFGIKAEYWFKTITAKINLLKETEEWLSEDLITQVNKLHDKAQTSQIFYIMLASSAGLMAAVMGFLIVCNITGTLGQARRPDNKGKEQASSIEQVNQAVMQMNVMTKQNAKLVKDAAATGKAITELSYNLAALVGQFKTRNDQEGSAVKIPSEETCDTLSKPETLHLTLVKNRIADAE